MGFPVEFWKIGYSYMCDVCRVIVTPRDLLHCCWDLVYSLTFYCTGK